MVNIRPKARAVLAILLSVIENLLCSVGWEEAPGPLR
jgi:hypothetical protein